VGGVLALFSRPEIDSCIILHKTWGTRKGARVTTHIGPGVTTGKPLTESKQRDLSAEVMVVGTGVVLVGVAETLSDHKGRYQLTTIKGIWF
jgi:hypothetical protein